MHSPFFIVQPMYCRSICSWPWTHLLEPHVHITRRSCTPRLTVVSVMERPQSRSQPIMLRVPLHIIQRWINSAQQLHGDCILRRAAATVATAVVGSHEIGQDGSAFQRKSWEWCEQTTRTSPRSQLMLSAESTWPAGTWIQHFSSSLTSWQLIMVFTVRAKCFPEPPNLHKLQND